MGEWIGAFLGTEHGHIANIGEGYAILIVGLFSLVGWHLARRASRAEYRRANAHRYIVSKDAEARSKIDAIRKYLRDGALAPAFTGLQVDEAYEKAALGALSEMETCAIDIAFGYVSEGYILMTQRNLLINIYQVFREFIATLRTNRKKPSTFSEFETLYVRVAYPQALGVIWVFEAMVGHPNFRLTRWVWRQKYSVVRRLYGLPVDHIEADPEKVCSALKEFHSRVVYPLIILVVIAALLVGYHAMMRLSA